MEIDIQYGLDYAMYRHDIERFEKVIVPDDNHSKCDAANTALEKGWKPLMMGYTKNGEIYFVMGVPREKKCTFHFGSIEKYDLQADKWECPKCKNEIPKDEPLF